MQLFLTGDSTMSDYESEVYPRMGWGQVLSNYVDASILVRNYATSGRSTKSFIDENRWEHAEEQFTPGDIVVIQFGHNDQKEDVERHTDAFSSYQDNLRFFIDRARSKDVEPILLTSVARRHFDKKGLLEETHGDYPSAVRQVAVEEGVPFIDMERLTMAYLQELGDEKSKELFMWVKPAEFGAYPEGEQDNTHFREEGAKKIAEIFVSELKRLKHPLAERIID